MESARLSWSTDDVGHPYLYAIVDRGQSNLAVLHQGRDVMAMANVSGHYSCA
jgi:hypothetical protein